MSTIASTSASTSAAPSARSVRKSERPASASPAGFRSAPLFLTRQQLADGVTLETLRQPASLAAPSSKPLRFTAWVQEAFDPRGYALKQYRAAQRLENGGSGE